MLRLYIILIFLIGMSSFNLSYSKSKSKMYQVQTAFAFVHKKPNSFSKIILQLKEGDPVAIRSTRGTWSYIEYKNKIKGYIHNKCIVKKLQKVNVNFYNILIKSKKDENIDSAKRGFSEEEDIAASSKGFSEEEELAASSKGFSEEEELAASSKGFSEEEEIAAASKGFKSISSQYSKKNNNKEDKKKRLNVIFKKFYRFDATGNLKKRKKILQKVQTQKSRVSK